MCFDVSVERDMERLEAILKIIADVDRRLANMDFQKFSSDGGEIHLKAFRLSVLAKVPTSFPTRSRHAIPPYPGRACTGLAILSAMNMP